MRKFTILLFAFTLILTAHSQTKEDTETWLKEKLETLGKREQTITFSNNTLTIYDPIDRLVFITKFLPTQIRYISFKESGNRITLEIKTTSGGTFKSAVNIDLKKVGDDEITNSGFIVLTKEVNNNNLKERIIKALWHWVELNGGKKPKETF